MLCATIESILHQTTPIQHLSSLTSCCRYHCFKLPIFSHLYWTWLLERFPYPSYQQSHSHALYSTSHAFAQLYTTHEALFKNKHPVLMDVEIDCSHFYPSHRHCSSSHSALHNLSVGSHINPGRLLGSTPPSPESPVAHTYSSGCPFQSSVS